MNIVIQLLIASLSTTPAAVAGVADLCDVVHRRTGVPTICKPHEEGAPVYNANVCCAGRTCFPSSSSGCKGREVLYYCELGEQQVTGEVDCYFEIPSYCEVYPCATSVTPPPLEMSLCCNEGVCWEHRTGNNDCELDDLYWCTSGMSNADGTITCLDEAD